MHSTATFPTFFDPRPVSASLGRLAMAAETFGRRQRAADGEGGEANGERIRWQARPPLPEAPGPAEVLPALPSKRLRIVCLAHDPEADLTAQVKATCRDQAQQGLKLSSTFSHDGSVFLVFKRL